MAIRNPYPFSIISFHSTRCKFSTLPFHFRSEKPVIFIVCIILTDRAHPANPRATALLLLLSFPPLFCLDQTIPQVAWLKSTGRYLFYRWPCTNLSSLIYIYKCVEIFQEWNSPRVSSRLSRVEFRNLPFPRALRAITREN